MTISPIEISPGHLAREIENGRVLRLLDVRQPWEHQTASLAQSVLVPLGELPARAAEIAIVPGLPLIVYCHHGVPEPVRGRILASARSRRCPLAGRRH